MSQMRFLVIRSQLLMGINKLKIVLNWKNTILFAKARVTYKTVFPCNSLRSGSTGHVYMILLHPPSFLDECTLIFTASQSLGSNRGLPAQQNQLDSGLLNLTAFLVPILVGIMSSWMPWKWKVAMEVKSNSLAFLAWPFGSHFDMRREKKIIPHYHSLALWKVGSYLSLYNYHFIILWERINLLITYSYVFSLASLSKWYSEGKCWIKKKHGL